MENTNNDTTTFGELFTASPCHDNGSEGCIQGGGECNTDWESYFSYTADSISMVAGNDCRTVSTADKCVFSLGEGGVTEISFDFDICESCHNKDTGVAWLAFWIYSKPWKNTLEVDFIESKFGPASNGLNTNFAGVGHQVEIFAEGTQAWKGSIVATFTHSGTNDVDVKVTNSVNTNVGTSTLTGRDGYFFVLDTATGTTATDCKITISNVKIEGTTNVPSNTGLSEAVSVTLTNDITNPASGRTIKFNYRTDATNWQEAVEIEAKGTPQTFTFPKGTQAISMVYYDGSAWLQGCQLTGNSLLGLSNGDTIQGQWMEPNGNGTCSITSS